MHSTPEYEKKRQALAKFRVRVGKDRFDLRFGLRKPRNPVEQMEVDFLQGRITEDQLKADAERPIDVAMLDAFRDAYEERLLAYSQMLQTVVTIATDQRDPDSWRRREAEVDSHVAAMKAKLPLWKEQLATVFGFLAELQAERKGEPVRCGDRSAESAYMLAELVMDQAAAGWCSGKEIAHRSRTDPRYSYATSASHLFYSSHLPGLPRPQDLQTLMVLEHARARKTLEDRAGSAETDPQMPTRRESRAGSDGAPPPAAATASTSPPASSQSASPQPCHGQPSRAKKHFLVVEFHYNGPRGVQVPVETVDGKLRVKQGEPVVQLRRLPNSDSVPIGVVGNGPVPSPVGKTAIFSHDDPATLNRIKRHLEEGCFLSNVQVGAATVKVLFDMPIGDNMFRPVLSVDCPDEDDRQLDYLQNVMKWAEISGSDALFAEARKDPIAFFFLRCFQSAQHRAKAIARQNEVAAGGARAQLPIPDSLFKDVMAAIAAENAAEYKRKHDWLRQDHSDYDQRVERMKADPRWAPLAVKWVANPVREANAAVGIELVRIRDEYAIPTQPRVNTPERLLWWMQKQRNPLIETPGASFQGGRYGYLVDPNHQARDFALDIRASHPDLPALPAVQNDSLAEWQSLCNWCLCAKADGEPPPATTSAGETSTMTFKQWAGGERVTLAIVFTDVVGSTALGEEMRDEAMNEVRRAHFVQSRKLITEFMGREIKTIGDSFMAAFKSADTALDFAWALHRNTGHPRVQIRAGIHIGPMDVKEDDVFGGEVDFAARVKEAIKGAEIWMSDRAKEDIQRLGARKHTRLRWVRHDGVALKGFPSEFTLWSLLG